MKHSTRDTPASRKAAIIRGCLVLGLVLSWSFWAKAEDAVPTLRLSQLDDAALVNHLGGAVLPDNQAPIPGDLDQRYHRAPNFGYLRAGRKAWLHLRLHNDTSTSEWILNIDAEAADYLDVYLVQPGAQPVLTAPLYRGGDRRPSDLRPYRFPAYFVPISLAPGQTRDLYVAAYGRSTLALDLSLGYRADQVEAATNRLALDVLLISVASAMLLFNLVMWRMDGERFRLSYVLYLSGIITFTLYNSGLGYLYVWPGSPWLQQVIPYFSLTLFFWGGYAFCQQFLRTAEYFPRLHGVINWVRFLGLGAIPLGLAGVIAEAVAVLTLANLAFFVIIVYLGVSATRRRLNSAPLFLVSWSVMVAGALIYNAYVQGLLPAHWVVERSMMLGVAFESLLMSVAQANYLRNRQLRQQRREQAAKEDAEQALQRLDEALQATRDANRSKDEFLRLVSHELRTPIMHSLGMLDQLIESGLSGSQRTLCQVLAQSTRLTQRQVESLLSYAELNAYRVASQPVSQDIRQGLEELVRTGRDADPGRHHTLVLEGVDSLPPRLTIDWLNTRQILGHLLDNALRHSPPGEVRLSVSHRDDHLICHLSDPGPGCDTDLLATPDAFAVRARQDQTTGGLGLGLYLSRALADIMGAELKPTGDGDGIELTIPAAIAPERTASTPRPLQAARVLVVEDNPVNVKVTTAMLSREGCDWDTAYDGRSGVEAASRQRYDLILMDCQMPVMDGFEAARIIRGSGGPNTRTPILAITANAMARDREQIFAAGMDDLIAKPFSRPELVERLAHWLARIDAPR